MGSLDTSTFSAPPETIAVDGLLFDFDGTIIDSTEAIVKHWHQEGNLMGIDPNVILATSHGRRSIDVFKIYDPSKANWEYISHVESLLPRRFGSDAVEIPGARHLLTQLEKFKAPWAVVTSGTSGLINGWISVLKLAHPPVLVVAEDVDNGKPDPSCYLLGQKRLAKHHGESVNGTDNQATKFRQLVVVEDAPSGIRAGKAAGFQVIGLATTHTIDQVREAGADWILKDLRSLKVENVAADGKTYLTLCDALTRD